jgi:drug/metabolite transporter (DMT)-like permease
MTAPGHEGQRPPRTSKRARVAVAYAVVAIVWGSTYLAIRIALETCPPLLLGGTRVILAGSLLLLAGRWRGEAWPRPRDWRAAAVTGGLFFVIGNGLIIVAEQASISTGVVSICVATMPLWATLFSRGFGERVSPIEWFGVLLGFAGVGLLKIGGDLHAQPWAVAAVLIAPMGWALGSVLSRRLPVATGLIGTALPMLAGGAEFMTLGILVRETPALPSLRSALAIAYLLVFGSIAGFTAYRYLLSHTRPAFAASYAYVNPLVAVVLGVTLAGEHFGASAALGAAIVIGAVAVVARARSLRPSER